MKEQNVSKAYAKAIIELGKESKIDVAKELTDLSELINKSGDLETLLFLDVFTVEEKLDVAKKVMAKINTSDLVQKFVAFLIGEKRMNLFPLVFKDVIVIDDHEKGFLRGTIEGSEDQVSDEFKNKMITYLKDKAGISAELKYVKNESITAGYRVTVEDLQLDASLDNQLEKFKETVLNN
ncbi:ATP synthase F1, delta subunit [Bacteriovorax sp. BSW11_IV]|uniref:F0F1 ATP synthase subunit delta n=1 Tax=Bacteriovorax sp. BSW11_IV TaxID=1353529 RepID=UPI00038A55A8|nr:F0F1 ATP synthase subunit delta [Bacteriovorax sp. BSW11_IV]EQC49994.1 ATP synthase F1, delta subunit [Bacteriovorax sp. BSW11_IV]